jgi:probable rRNA maturation factor
MIRIEMAIRVPVKLDRRRLRSAIRAILKDAAISHGEISLAIVSDDEIHTLNKKFLQHDYPTDVLSFRLDEATDRHTLEGEIIVSWDRACCLAEQVGWSPEDELLLYVIHGCLHLVGYDDHSPGARRIMREQEANYLGRIDPQLQILHQSHCQRPSRRSRRRR